VGVGSSRQPAFGESYGGHEMPPPQKKTRLHWKPGFDVALHQLEHERFANEHFSVFLAFRGY
jgi:hypothetical protein